MSNIIELNSYPTIPTNLLATYDGYEVDLSWDSIDFTDGANASFLNYNIYNEILTPVSSASTLTNSILYNTSFIVGKAIWVIDNFSKSFWFGDITVSGEFTLDTTSKMSNQSDVIDTTNPDNFTVYLETSSTGTLIGTSTSTGYADTNITFGNFYLYKVCTLTSTGYESSFIKYPVYTLAIANSSPYFRSVLNSDTLLYTSTDYYTLTSTGPVYTSTGVVVTSSGLLNNQNWISIKNSLIDKHYYNKTKYAIPYSATETYKFKAYLGISKCYFDIFINGNYGFTTSTGTYGEVSFEYKFPKGQTDLQFVARDKRLNTSSKWSATFVVTTLNLYTWYSLLGIQYQDISTELDNIKSDTNLLTVRLSSYEDIYASLIELYKYGAEDDDLFRNLALQVFNSYEYTGFDKGIRTLLDGFQDNVPYFDHYEIYYNNNLYDTLRSGLAYVPQLSSIDPCLTRDDYYYAITSVSALGEETSAYEIRVDDRWWPPRYKGINVLRWTPTTGAVSYNIYKGTSTGYCYYIQNAPLPIFIDMGNLIPTTDLPPDMNFTDYDPPTDLYVDIHKSILSTMIFLRKKSWMQILLFSEGRTWISPFQLERITFFLKKLIPPELRYSVSYANDVTVSSNSYAAENKYYCTGDISSAGITLDSTNKSQGYFYPEDLSGLYDNTIYPGIYGLTQYGFTALYESELFTVSKDVAWIAVGDPGDILFTYRTKASYSVSWTDWVAPIDAIGNKTVAVIGENLQFAFIFLAPSWFDTDSVIVYESGSNITYKNILSFVIGVSVGVITGTDISVTVPYGTSLSSLTATFVSNGSFVSVNGLTQVSGVTSNDFTNILLYRVTAADTTTKDYLVTVVNDVAPVDSKDILSFSILGIAATITGTNIYITLPEGTTVTALIPTFIIDGSYVKIEDTIQTSGVSSNNFTNSLPYTVVSLLGSTKEYTVTVAVTPSSTKSILTFSIGESIGVISGNTISVVLASESNLTGLVAKFTTSGASVKIGTVTQESNISVNDFLLPVTYIVTAIDTSTQEYIVTVSIPVPSFNLTFGSVGTGDGQFTYPVGITSDSSNNLYVVDRDNNRIQKFNSSGTYSTKWGSLGTADGLFTTPVAIACNNSNNIFVVDRDNSRIQKFTNTGTYVSKFGSLGNGQGEFSNPSAIAIDSNNSIYVTDLGNSRVQKFTSAGVYVTSWGNGGTGNGNFKYPSAITVGNDNTIFVADIGNNRVQKFTSTGVYMIQWGSYGTTSSKFDSPSGIVSDVDGNIFVVDKNNNRIQKFDSIGTYILSFGSAGSTTGKFNEPIAIEIDSSNAIYVVDYNNNRIQKFTV